MQTRTSCGFSFAFISMYRRNQLHSHITLSNLKTTKTMDVKKQSKVLEFLAQNPNSNFKTISKATKISDTMLTNILKRVEEGGVVSVTGKGKDMTYSMKPKQKKEEKAEAAPAVTVESPNEIATTEKVEKVKTKSTGGRDNRKFKFNGQEYGKGPLVLAVVGAYVKKNPKTTLAQLKKLFPDELLHRYGIFQEVKEAKKLSGNRDRYFLKHEQIIPIKDAAIAVCNQFTAENIQPFLKVAKEQGISIK
jgi:DNA-binding HxlR family transcriptional regulator